MNGREFRRYARRTGRQFYIDSRRGKGSHQVVYIGNLRTTVQHGEIPNGTLASMISDLEIDREGF